MFLGAGKFRPDGVPDAEQFVGDYYVTVFIDDGEFDVQYTTQGCFCVLIVLGGIATCLVQGVYEGVNPASVYEVAAALLTDGFLNRGFSFLGHRLGICPAWEAAE